MSTLIPVTVIRRASRETSLPGFAFGSDRFAFGGVGAVEGHRGDPIERVGREWVSVCFSRPYEAVTTPDGEGVLGHHSKSKRGIVGLGGGFLHSVPMMVAANRLGGPSLVTTSVMICPI